MQGGVFCVLSAGVAGLRVSLPPRMSAAGDVGGRRLIPFLVARETAQRLGMRTQEEWQQWVSDNKPGVTSTYRWYMPDQPDAAYDEFDGWDDWLGVPLSYDEARSKVGELGIPSQEAWWAFSREQHRLLMRLRVPGRPHIYYVKEWNGYDEWLGLPDTPLVLPSGYGRGDFGASS